MTQDKKWPSPLGPAAHHGPLGDYAEKIAPHTEGDPAAILVQTLVCFGNAVGRNPHFTIEDTRHGTNLNLMVVGDTGTARKGTSLDRARKLISAADGEWGAFNDGEGGLSSAEGLIYAVRDATDISNAATDKRLLAAMGEFAETLSRMKRQENALGATLRNAWDGKTLRVRTRKEPLIATEAHISVIGHITRADLTVLLDNAEIWNGFANRFLWVVARQAQKLPFGGTLRVDELPEIVDPVRAALCWADEEKRNVGFAPDARKVWPQFYDELTRGAEGRLGPVTDRGPAQVRRLALVYAVADKSPRVRRVHLIAAMEVWRYSEDSARYLFAEAPVDLLESRLVKVLSRRKGWVSRSDVLKAINGEFQTYRLTPALDELVAAGRLERKVTPTSGRPRTEYRLTEITS